MRMRQRARGPGVWELRYRVTEGDERKMKTVIVGTIDEFPTEADARFKVQQLLAKINSLECRSVQCHHE